MSGAKVLSVRYLDNASASLCRALGAPADRPCLAMLTADCDDATYIALDEATKKANVTVCYGESFYGGAANAVTPYAGEVIGILAAPTPGEARSGMQAALDCLKDLGFSQVGNVPCLAHTVSRTGSFLSGLAGVPEGSALAYLIAPPLESMYAMDMALKAAEVKLCKLYPPPSHTNFGGGLLSGTQSACEAACAAFTQAVAEVAGHPVAEQ